MHFLKTPMQRKAHMWSQQIVQSKDQSILSMKKNEKLIKKDTKKKRCSQ
jgi:hypothetical protein